MKAEQDWYKNLLVCKLEKMKLTKRRNPVYKITYEENCLWRALTAASWSGLSDEASLWISPYHKPHFAVTQQNKLNKKGNPNYISVVSILFLLESSTLKEANSHKSSSWYLTYRGRDNYLTTTYIKPTKIKSALYRRGVFLLWRAVFYR